MTSDSPGPRQSRGEIAVAELRAWLVEKLDHIEGAIRDLAEQQKQTNGRVGVIELQRAEEHGASKERRMIAAAAATHEAMSWRRWLALAAIVATASGSAVTVAVALFS